MSPAGSVYDARMAIYLDDQPTKLTGNCLGEILASATEGLASGGGGRVVVEVMLDGKVLNGDELGDHQNTELGDTEVRLTTADPKDLAVTTLLQVRQALPQAGGLHEKAAELLQADKAGEALEYIGAAIEVWMQAQEAVLGSAGVVGLGLDDVTVDGEPMTAFTDELIEQLHGLKDLIAAGDTVALADAMAYEWPPIVHRWDKLIETLIDVIQKSK